VREEKKRQNDINLCIYSIPRETSKIQTNKSNNATNFIPDLKLDLKEGTKFPPGCKIRKRGQQKDIGEEILRPTRRPAAGGNEHGGFG
jgi:hypothetical protein